MGKLSRELRMGIHNRFDIEVVDAKTGEVKQKAVAYNVVCNEYFNAIINGTIAENILVGGGSGTPSANDTTLFSYIGYASTTDGTDTVNDSDEYRGIWLRILKRTIQYDQYVNQAITEVGLASGTSGTILTHAMLQDMNGNPISILHTSTDIINIYCNIYLHYANQGHGVHLYTVKRTVSAGRGCKYYGFVHRILLMNYLPYRVDGYGTWRNNLIPAQGIVFMSKQDVDPTQDSIEGLNISLSGNSQNRTLTLTVSRYPTGRANMNGIYSLGVVHSDRSNTTYRGCPDIIIEAGVSIPSATITNESVGIGDGVTTKFKTKFIRPYDASVYVNGIKVTSGVTVKKTRMEALNENSYSIRTKGDTNKETYLYMKPVYDKNIHLPIVNPEYDNNPNYSVVEMLDPEIGLYRIYSANGTVKGSNDGETWIDVETSTANTQMNQAGAHYKYYKFSSGKDALMNAYDGYNIIFDTPPANGDVITIDYKTDSIPKDSDHVLDVSITFTFGEWRGE